MVLQCFGACMHHVNPMSCCCCCWWWWFFKRSYLGSKRRWWPNRISSLLQGDDTQPTHTSSGAHVPVCLRKIFWGDENVKFPKNSITYVLGVYVRNPPKFHTVRYGVKYVTKSVEIFRVYISIWILRFRDFLQNGTRYRTQWKMCVGNYRHFARRHNLVYFGPPAKNLLSVVLTHSMFFSNVRISSAKGLCSLEILPLLEGNDTYQPTLSWGTPTRKNFRGMKI